MEINFIINFIIAAWRSRLAQFPDKEKVVGSSPTVATYKVVISKLTSYIGSNPIESAIYLDF